MAFPPPPIKLFKNDLNRSKNVTKYRYKLPGLGSSPGSSVITIPSLDPFNNEVVFFETQIDFTGLGNGLVTEDGRLYGNSILGNPVLSLNGNPFYSGATLSATTRYSQKSLYFIDNSFKSKSINFDFLLDEAKNYSLRRDFYNTSGVETTSTYAISVFDFNNLNVVLSTNPLSVIGDTDQNIQIKITNSKQSGNIVDGKTNFKIDFGANGDRNESSIFSNLLNIETVNYTYTEPFTGTNTLTLSTIRNDGFASDLITTTLNVNVLIAFTFSFNAITRNNISTTWNTISGLDNPNNIEDKYRFLTFDSNKLLSGAWNTEWWGYSARDIYNFSGTSYSMRGTSGNKDENNITLITPKHGICNSHWGSSEDPNVGDSAFFYDHTTGDSVSAEVISVSATGRSDITMVKFDRDLTQQGNIKVYKLPRFDGIGSNYSAVLDNKLATLTQGGNGPFGTGETDCFAGLGCSGKLNQSYGGIAAGNYFETKNARTSLASVSSVFSNSFFGLSSFNVGDSSSPTFIIYDNDILLSSTLYATSSDLTIGPGYGLSAIQAVLSSGLIELGNSEGYELSTVRIY